MKKLLFLCLLALITLACNPGAPTPPADAATSDATAKSSEPEKAAPKPTIPVNIPEKGADWVDHKINETSPKVVISTPKGFQIYASADGINVMMNDNQSMYIRLEPMDIAATKQEYLDNESREGLEWLLETPTEVLYMGTDLSAPKGHQTTHSFFATKKIGNIDFSTSVDGITIMSDTEIYNLTAEEAQLLLGIFRTLKAQ
jgi:hypothetical protein